MNGLTGLLFEAFVKISAAIFSFSATIIDSWVFPAAQSEGDGYFAINSLSSFYGPILRAMIPLGFALCALFFLIQFIELAMSQQFTFDIFVKFFAKLAVGVFAVDYSETLLNKLVEFSNAFMSDVIAAATNSTLVSLADHYGDYKDAFLECCETQEWASLLIFAIAVMIGIPMILFAIVEYVCVFIIFATRAIEFGVRAAFLPVALALLSDDGWRGAGGRYIKKLLAVTAQGAVLIVICFMTKKLMDNAAGSMASFALSSSEDLAEMFKNILGTLKGPLANLAIGVAGIAFMFKSMQVTSDVFGA